VAAMMPRNGEMESPRKKFLPAFDKSFSKSSLVARRKNGARLSQAMHP
jgi:hypothetical protein